MQTHTGKKFSGLFFNDDKFTAENVYKYIHVCNQQNLSIENGSLKSVKSNSHLLNAGRVLSVNMESSSFDALSLPSVTSCSDTWA